MDKAALILEGGALRGIYSAGVMDIFLENDILFPYVIGISAGALNGLSYISKQAGRTAKVTLEYVNDSRYLGFRRFVKDHAIFNFDFMFGELAHELVPFDYNTFENSSQRFVAVATSCLTGEPVYCEKGVCADIYTASAASGSMPLLSKMIFLDGIPCLDGGIGVSTGLPQALAQGYTKPVMILTRAKGYRKSPVSAPVRALYERFFGNYPAFLQKLLTVPERYNMAMDEIDLLEHQGNLFVLRPAHPVKVARMEKDIGKLEDLYWEGRIEAEQALPWLKEYLKE